MYRKYVYSRTTWYDILSADTSELSEIANLYKLEDSLIKKISNSPQETEIKVYGKHTFVSLNIPQFTQQDSLAPIPNKNISFIIGDDFVITSRFSDIKGLKQFKKELINYSVDPKNFPSFFFKTMLIYFYKEIKLEIVLDIPKNKIQNPNEMTRGKYLTHYKTVLDSHNHVFEKILDGKFSQIHADDQVSFWVVIKVFNELQNTILEQNRVCITCLYPIENRLFSFLNFLK